MKKILLLLTVLFCFLTGYSQFPVNQYIGSNKTLVTIKGGVKADSTFVVPNFPDTTGANLNGYAPYYAGNIIRVNNTLYIRSSDSTRWIPIANNGGVSTTYTGTQLISGDAVWQQDLIFDVTPCTYYILGTFYSSLDSTVTLAPADSNYPRIDVIYLDTLGNVGVLTGVPSPSPSKPVVNPLSQIELTHIDIAALATEPTGISSRLVYNENTQLPNEWNTITDDVSNNFNYAINPYIGAKSLLIPEDTKGSFVAFENTDDVDADTCRLMSFYLRLNSVQPSSTTGVGGLTRPLFYLELYKDGIAVSNRLSLIDGSYGYNLTDTGYYQHITINFDQFVFSDTTNIFDEIVITTSETPKNGYQIDYFTIQRGGYEPPVISDSWVLQGNDVTTIVNPKLGTTSNHDLNIVTNDSSRIVIPKEGVRRDTTGIAERTITYDTATKRIYYNNLGYSYMEQLDSTHILLCRKPGDCDTLESLTAYEAGNPYFVTDVYLVSGIGADTLKYTKGLVNYTGGTIPYQNGLYSGGIVTNIDTTAFAVTAAIYRLLGLGYSSSADTVVLPKNNDTLGLYAVIGVNNTGNVFYTVGAASTNPQVPSINPTTEVGLSTVYFPENNGTPIINNYTTFTTNIGVDSSAFTTTYNATDSSYVLICDRSGRCDTIYSVIDSNIVSTVQRLRDTSLSIRSSIPPQFNPIAGTNVTLSGSYPNITFNATGGGSSIVVLSTEYIVIDSFNLVAPPGIDVINYGKDDAVFVPNNTIYIDVDVAMSNKETIIISDMRSPGYDPAAIIVLKSGNGYGFAVQGSGGTSLNSSVDITNRTVRISQADIYDSNPGGITYLVFFM